jgi:hypothetical protein
MDSRAGAVANICPIAFRYGRIRKRRDRPRHAMASVPDRKSRCKQIRPSPSASHCPTPKKRAREPEVSIPASCTRTRRCDLNRSRGGREGGREGGRTGKLKSSPHANRCTGGSSYRRRAHAPAFKASLRAHVSTVEPINRPVIATRRTIDPAPSPRTQPKASDGSCRRQGRGTHAFRK